MSASKASWSDLINLFERDLIAAGSASKTISAYRRDLTQFSRRITETKPDPLAVGHRDVRHYAAFLSGSGCAPAGGV